MKKHGSYQMKDKGAYKYGMHEDRNEMGEKPMMQKMKDYFPQQSDYLTEDGRAIDASKPKAQMKEAGEDVIIGKKGKSYTQEQVDKMSDRKKIRKGIRPGIESEPEGYNPKIFKYDFDIKGNIKTDPLLETPKVKRRIGSKIGGNPEDGGGRFNINLKRKEKSQSPSEELVNKPKEMKLTKTKTKAHYLKGNKFMTSRQTTRMHKKNPLGR